jgi:hypothetical protein
MQLDAYEL